MVRVSVDSRPISYDGGERWNVWQFEHAPFRCFAQKNSGFDTPGQTNSFQTDASHPPSMAKIIRIVNSQEEADNIVALLTVHKPLPDKKPVVAKTWTRNSRGSAPMMAPMTDAMMVQDGGPSAGHALFSLNEKPTVRDNMPQSSRNYQLEVLDGIPVDQLLGFEAGSIGKPDVASAQAYFVRDTAVNYDAGEVADAQQVTMYDFNQNQNIKVADQNQYQDEMVNNMPEEIVDIETVDVEMANENEGVDITGDGMSIGVDVDQNPITDAQLDRLVTACCERAELMKKWTLSFVCQPHEHFYVELRKLVYGEDYLLLDREIAKNHIVQSKWLVNQLGSRFPGCRIGNSKNFLENERRALLKRQRESAVGYVRRRVDPKKLTFRAVVKALRANPKKVMKKGAEVMQNGNGKVRCLSVKPAHVRMPSIRPGRHIVKKASRSTTIAPAPVKVGLPTEIEVEDMARKIKRTICKRTRKDTQFFLWLYQRVVGSFKVENDKKKLDFIWEKVNQNFPPSPTDPEDMQKERRRKLLSSLHSRRSPQKKEMNQSSNKPNVSSK